MSFGASTIIFRTSEETGSPDDFGHYATVDVDTEAAGCRHRPLTFTEKVEFNLDIATEYWRSTVPLFEYDATLQATLSSFPVDGSIEVDGIGYQIIGGVRPHPDRFGSPYKATIISMRQHG